MIVKRERILHVFPSLVLLNRAWEEELQKLANDNALYNYSIKTHERVIKVGTTTYQLAVIRTTEDAFKHSGMIYSDVKWHYTPDPDVEIRLRTYIRIPK